MCDDLKSSPRRQRLVTLVASAIVLSAYGSIAQAATETHGEALAPGRSLKIAAIAPATTDGLMETNYQRALQLTETASRERPDIILLPEVFAAGYCADDLAPYAETLEHSKPLQEFRHRSREYGCMIVLGFLESCSDGLRNAAVIFDRGEVVGVHHKSSLWPDDQRPWRDERRLVLPGKGMEAFPTRFGRLGVLVCYENMIDSNWDALKDRTDFVLSLYNCEDDPAKHNIRGSQRLQVPSAWADRTGMYYRGKQGLAPNPGTAGMVDAAGTVLAKSEVGVEQIVHGTLEVRPLPTGFVNPAPPGLTTASNLTLKVDGVPVWVENLTKACPHDAPDWFRYNTSNNLVVNIASFTCTNACKLTLHLQQQVKALTVRPKHLRIAAAGRDRDWTLELPAPCKLYVEAESLPPLLVFADPPEDSPFTDLTRTRIFGPGVHNPGLITLEDNARVYLAPGAVVYGGFRGGPRNARIFGRGILDGSNLSSSMLRLDGASNVVVEGIIMRCGRAWQNTLQNCDNITYRNVKILSFVPYGDGIDPVCSRNIRIENCFFRCSDDCIAVKAMRGGPAVSGISVRDCIMVGYNFSDGFTIGYETVTEVIEGITVGNCDILYARGATKAGQHSAFSIICDGPATVRDVTFEDIRVEENITRMFELNVTDGAFYSQAPPGRIQRVRLKNISWEKVCPILLAGHNAEHLVEDVVFEGCRVAGVPLSAAQIQTNAFTRGIAVR
jgi:predicted amidohydrolase